MSTPSGSRGARGMRRRRHVGRRAGTGTAARGVAIVDELGFVPFERTGGALLGALEGRGT